MVCPLTSWKLLTYKHLGFHCLSMCSFKSNADAWNSYEMVLVHPGALAQVQSLQNFWRRQVQVAGSDIARKNLLLFCALRLASASLDCSCCRCKVCKNLDCAAGSCTAARSTTWAALSCKKLCLLCTRLVRKACRILKLVYRRLMCLQIQSSRPNIKTVSDNCQLCFRYKTEK